MNEHLQHIPAIKELISVLDMATASIKAIVNLPDSFRIRAEKTLTILSNSSAHAIDIPISEFKADIVEEFGPITNFLGKEITPRKPIDPKTVTAETNEFQEFKKKCTAIMDAMSTMSPKQFFDALNENEIRGVAKLLGMSITSTDPEIITMEFIHEMYAAHALKLETDALEGVVGDSATGIVNAEKMVLIDEITEFIIAQGALIEPGVVVNDEMIAEGKERLLMFSIEQLTEMLDNYKNGKADIEIRKSLIDRNVQLAIMKNEFSDDAALTQVQIDELTKSFELLDNAALAKNLIPAPETAKETPAKEKTTEVETPGTSSNKTGPRGPYKKSADPKK